MNIDTDLDILDTDLDSNDDFDCEDEDDEQDPAEIHGLDLDNDADVDALCDYLDCDDEDLDDAIVEKMRDENCNGAMVLLGARMKAAGIEIHAVQGKDVAPADVQAVATLKMLFAARK